MLGPRNYLVSAWDFLEILEIVEVLTEILEMRQEINREIMLGSFL